MPLRPVYAFVLACLLSTTSCQYLADRAMDALDPYRAVIGLGSVIGARGRFGGLAETGLMVGVKPRPAALGWRYGVPLYFNERDSAMDADQSEIVWNTSVVGLEYSKGSYVHARNSVAVLPALLTWVDSTPTDYEWQVPEKGEDYEDRHWLWSREGFRNNRYQQIHAFDTEVEAGLLLYADFGFSPGEALDFLLGLATIDIAKDDGRL